jgi:hypothetical protein
MMLRRITLGVAGAAMSLLAPLAQAQLPAAMDRLPADALVVGGIRNLDQFNAEVRAMAESLKLGDAMGPLDHITAVLKTPGVNSKGSAAFAMVPPAGGAADGEEGGEPGMVMILPVSDYKALVEALGGTPSSGIDQVTLQDHTLFVKSLDGGYILSADKQELLEGFVAKPGAGAGFEKMLGASGKAVADKSDIFFIANIPALAPKLKEGIEQMKQQGQMFAMMAGGQGPDFEKFGALAEEFVRDAQSAVLGLDLGEAGVSLGMGAQFTEGSSFAGYFQGKGDAPSLIAALPNQPFLLAFAMDSSTPGIKSFVKRMSEMNAGGQMMGPMGVAKMIDQIDGTAFFLGTTPAIMGGLFLNTTAYIKAKDPSAYLSQTKQTFEEMNKKEINGITFLTSYQAESATVGNNKVDVWTMKMQPDPTNPNSAQIAQMQTMLFGPTGLGGYMAKTDKGVVVTYSKNSSLLEQALQSAAKGEGLSKEAGVSQVAAQLPEARTLAGYVGIKNIMEIGIGFMAMIPGAPAVSFEIPQDLPPVGFGGTGDQGGFHSRIFVPTQVIQTIKDFAEAAQKQAAEEGMGDENKEGDEGTGQPKF